MTPQPEFLTHNTFQEMKFLDELGYHSEIKNRNRRLLLMNYLAAMSKRKEWGDLDRDAIRKHCLRRMMEAA